MGFKSGRRKISRAYDSISYDPLENTYPPWLQVEVPEKPWENAPKQANVSKLDAEATK